MPREHDARAAPALARVDADIRFAHRDGLAMEAPLEGDLERPREQRHLEPRERQYGPEAAQREQCRDPERHDARAGEKELRGTHAERAVRADLDAQRLAFHARPMVARE